MKRVVRRIASAAFLISSAPPAMANPVQVITQAGVDLPVPARAAAQEMVTKGVEGVTIVYGNRQHEISRVHVGAISPDTQYPIASASKWLTAAVVMTLVDAGRLSLDAPVSSWLSGAPGETGRVTLRQLLSQTSGLSGSLSELYDLRQDHRITLRQSADEILARPFVVSPGTEFTYGGPGFQVVGAVVEAVTGQTWEEVFQSRIAHPLGMRHTYWTHLKLGEPTPPAAKTRNPVLQGGAVSTADDYGRFLQMLAHHGKFGGRHVLSHAAVNEMLTDQTPHARMNSTGAAVLENAHYSLGNWCETWDALGTCTRSSSIGAFGVYPWVDGTTGNYGLLFLKREQDAFSVWPEMRAIQSALTEAQGTERHPR